jgi:hypothetical protein
MNDGVLEGSQLGLDGINLTDGRIFNGDLFRT